MQVEEMEIYIKQLEEKMQELREMSVSIKSSANDNERVQSSGNHDKMAESVLRLIESEKDFAFKINMWCDMRDKMQEQIEALPNMMYRTVLFARYFNKKTFEEIAVDTHYSWRQIMRIHKKALRCFEERYLR